MRTRGVILAWTWTVLSISTGVLSTVRMQPLRRESDAHKVANMATNKTKPLVSCAFQYADEQSP